MNLLHAPVFWLSTGGALFCAATTASCVRPFIDLLQNSQQIKRNYRGQPVPAAAGVLLVLVFAVGCFVTVAVPSAVQSELAKQLPALLVLALGMGVTGLFDDMAGSRDAGGFKGHLQKFAREGTLTTGLIKAIAGFVFALGVVVWAQVGNGLLSTLGLGKLLLDALVIALTANWINLLDVRPGRALKGALAVNLLLFVYVRGVFAVPLGMLGGIVAAYFPFDVKAKAMMGDSGSNFIGAILGYVAVQSMDQRSLLLALTALAGLHIYTELYSLSRLIERNGVLAWIDDLGQEEAQ